MKLKKILLISALIPALAQAALPVRESLKTQPVIVNASADTNQVINQILAIVNNGVITQSDLDQGLLVARQQITQSGLPMPDDLSLQRQVLHQLILQKIELELADLNQVTVSQADTDQEIADIASRNKMSMEQLKTALSQQGVNYDNYWQDINNHLIIRKLEQQAVANHIMITPDEVTNYLAAKAKLTNPNTQYQIEHILLPLPSDPTAENLSKAQKRAEEIVAKIKGGLIFSKAAMEYSQSEDALQGGDLGFKTADQLPAVFADIVQNMQIGEVLGPIQNDTGFHIVKLIGKKTPSEATHFITETHVQDILIKTSPLIDDAKAKAILSDLRAQLVKGASFAALAKANSQDLTSVNNGGDMGFISPNEVDPQFAAVMDNTPVHALSDPFQTKNGWYLIQVLARKQQDDTENYLKEQAQNYLFQQKVSQALEQWQNTILGDSYVKILNPDLQMPNAQ